MTGYDVSLAPEDTFVDGELTRESFVSPWVVVLLASVDITTIRTLTEVFAQIPRLSLIAESSFTISDDGTDPMFFFTRSLMSTTRIWLRSATES